MLVACLRCLSCTLLQCCAGNVWQEYDVLHAQQLRLDRRFILEDIQACCSNCFALQCSHQRFLINNRTACSINKDGCRLHHFEFTFTDQVMGGRHIRCVNADKVRLPEHVFHWHVCHMVRGFFFRLHSVDVIIEHLHVKAAGTPGYQFTDTAGTNQSKG